MFNYKILLSVSSIYRLTQLKFFKSTSEMPLSRRTRGIHHPPEVYSVQQNILYILTKSEQTYLQTTTTAEPNPASASITLPLQNVKHNE